MVTGALSAKLRFIVEAYLDRQVAARQTVYEEDFNRASLSVSMKLHARNYRILVWADYVNAETPEQGLVYDAKNLAFILPAGKYIGNSQIKVECYSCRVHSQFSFGSHFRFFVQAVTLNLNLAMNLSLAERAPVTITRASETNYLRRFRFFVQAASIHQQGDEQQESALCQYI